MSNPQTFYIVGTLDLSGIFQPYTSGNNAATGYKISTGQDLSGIFQPYSGSGSKAPVTNYFVYNYNGQGIKDLSDIFAPYNPLPYTTNGIVSNTNPFVTSAPNNGYTYILFNSSTTNNFTINVNIPNLYYMIVGAGGTGSNSSANGNYIGGSGGGSGGCWNNSIVDFSANSYTITIPAITAGLYTKLTNNSNFTLEAQNGQLLQRGEVKLNTTILSPVSSTPNDQGVGGSSGQNAGASPGGGLYLNPGNTGNYLTFLGDNLISNTYFGGGGGGGAGIIVTTGANGNGGNGGGGGGGAGVKDGIRGTGGIGTNGSNGANATTNNGSNGGNAFNSIGLGYGGGGGGGGAGSASSPAGVGGSGGGAVLLLYFQLP